MIAGFALSYEIYVDGVPVEDEIQLSTGMHSVQIEINSENLTLVNYSITVNPSNIAKLLEKSRFPLSDTVNEVIPSGVITHSGDVEIPDIICGTYSVFGEVYYTESGILSKEEVSKTAIIPCEGIKAKLLYFAIFKLPWFIVKLFVGGLV